MERSNFLCYFKQLSFYLWNSWILKYYVDSKQQFTKFVNKKDQGIIRYRILNTTQDVSKPIFPGNILLRKCKLPFFSTLTKHLLFDSL